MDARCYKKPAENLMTIEQAYCAATQVQRDFNRKKGIQDTMVGTHIVHTSTHLFMNFSKPNYTLVPTTTMYRYGVKAIWVHILFTPNLTHTNATLTHTHKFLFLIQIIPIFLCSQPLPRISKKYGLFD